MQASDYVNLGYLPMSEENDYKTTLRQYDLNENDFDFNMEDLTLRTENVISILNHTVTIRFKRTEKEKTYHQAQWLAEFNQDLEDGYYFKQL